MVAFFVLFFPAVITLRIYEAVKKTDLSRKQWLYHYCTNVLVINLLCFLIKRFILLTDGDPLYTLYMDATPSAASNYLIMALPIAIVLAFVQLVLSKHVKVESEEDRSV